MGAKRILYVEDNFQNKRLIRKILNAKGYDVLEADSGEQAIQIALQEHPDLILMDINMPGMDGMQATKILKDNQDTVVKTTPVIALTAQAMKGDKEKIMAAGCDDYLQKPINTTQLMEMIALWLGKSAVKVYASSDEEATTSPNIVNSTPIAPQQETRTQSS